MDNAVAVLPKVPFPTRLLMQSCVKDTQCSVGKIHDGCKHGRGESILLPKNFGGFTGQFTAN